MDSLYLLRHAKSDWSNVQLGDFDRPLNARGRRAADAMGRYMAQQGYSVDLILCSAAARTRETARRFLDTSGFAPDIEYRDDLYLAGTRRLLEVLCGVGPGHGAVMLIGHNPGMQALGLMLAGSGPTQAIDALHTKYPTAGLLDFDLDQVDARHIGPGKARLRHFIRPKDIVRWSSSGS